MKLTAAELAYGSLRAAPRRRTKARNYPGTRIMIGTENGGRSPANTWSGVYPFGTGFSRSVGGA